MINFYLYGDVLNELLLLCSMGMILQLVVTLRLILTYLHAILVCLHTFCHMRVSSVFHE